MTGLDRAKDRIIQIAALITDDDLNIVDTNGFQVTVHQSKEVMDGMDEWCIKQHGASGLTAAVLGSKVGIKEAEDQMFAYITKHVPDAGKGLLCGSSVHADRGFMELQMPRVVGYLHHRVIDVSSIKELARRWRPDIAESAPKKKGAHVAMEDIRESLAELAHYRKEWLH